MTGRDVGGCAGGSAWLYWTCARFFLPGERSRQLWHHLVMSLSFCLHRGLGVKRRVHMSLGASSSGFLVVAHSVTLCEEPQTLSCSYLSASWGVRLQLYREVFFVWSSVSAQGYLEHPKLVYLSCFRVNQVSHHPASLRPSIWVARTTIFRCKLEHGINNDFGEPTNPFSVHVFGHIYIHFSYKIYENME